MPNVKCQMSDKPIIRYWKFVIGSIGHSPQRQAGFTLIELLAVISIMGVVGTLMFGILFTTLQGANKSQSVSTIQQNGDFVLGQISRMLRFASGLENPATCYTQLTPTPVQQTSITILNNDNNTTTFSCDLASGTIASNGAALLDPSTVAVTACSFTCQQNTPNDFPTFTITFTLNKKNNNNLVENSSPIIFSTSVTLRNIR